MNKRVCTNQQQRVLVRHKNSMQDKILFNAMFVAKIILAIVVIALFTSTQGNAMFKDSEHIDYYVKVNSRGALVNLYINDVPLVKVKVKVSENYITTKPVNLWLKEGVNTFSYTIYDNNKEETYNPSFDAVLFIHDKSKEVPTPLKTLEKIQFVSNKDSKYPIDSTLEFKIDGSINTQLWRDAEKFIALTKEDKKEIVTLIDRLALSILSDPQQAISIQKYKITEDALAQGKTVERVTDAVLKEYQWLSSQKGLTISKSNREQLNYEIHGNGHLVNVTKNNQDAIIILEYDDLFFDIDLYFAKIKGRWIIAR